MAAFVVEKAFVLGCRQAPTRAGAYPDATAVTHGGASAGQTETTAYSASPTVRSATVMVGGRYDLAPANAANRRGFRDPDTIAGGTWEALGRIMQQAGYFKGGLVKIAAARAIGDRMDPSRSQSRSFQVFYSAVIEAVS